MKKIFTSVLAMFMLVLSITSSLIVTATDQQINYRSTISYNQNGHESLPSALTEYVYEYRRKQNDIENNNIYFVIENYDLYKYFGFSDKSKTFFKDNLLILNCVYGGIGSRESRKNTGITIKDGIVNVSYTCSIKYPVPDISISAYDFIELKKSDVKGIDLTRETVNIKTTHMNFGEDPHDDYQTIEMKYIDAYDVIDKPEKVKKVKVQSTKTKQLKVTWKKISGAKYQVKYSLKKGMKNSKVKKNVKTNSVTLKKLKSEKKYYVRVRAYIKVGSKTYYGKWSKKAVKTVK